MLKVPKIMEMGGRTWRLLLVFCLGFTIAFVGSSLSQIVSAASSAGQIVNRSNHECLDNFFDQQKNENFLSTYACTANYTGQRWTWGSSNSLRTSGNYCVDVPYASRAAGTRVWLWQCNGSPAQEWQANSNGTISNPNSGLCLEITANDTFLGGPNLLVQPCNAANTRQLWNTSIVQTASEPTSIARKPLSTKPGGWAWQWQLNDTVNETVLDKSTNPNKLYDIDMFEASPALIARLKAKGIYVVCYVEVGDYAAGRPDAKDFPQPILSTNGIDTFDERYINVADLDKTVGPTGKTLRQIMTARLQLAASKGCDGIEPDLDDLHTYDSIRPFKISKEQQIAYNTFLIQTGHALGMSVGLKNGADQGGAGSFTRAVYDAGADFVINEECNQWNECNGYKQFIEGGRPVFQVEYLDYQKVGYGGPGGTCASNNKAGFDGIVKDSSSSLRALPRIACRTGN